MALRRFSDNPAATLPLDGTETLPALQAGVDVQVTVQDVIDAASGAVTSVNGATGAVVLEADGVPFDNTASGLTATDVQGAIDEIAAGGGGSGDVTGPASSVAGNFALFADTTGKEIEDGGAPGGMAFIDDAPSDGTGYVRKDGAWEAESGGGGGSDVVDVITPTNSSGTVTLDFASKSKYIGAITLGANVTTLAVSNLPGAGKYAEYELHITQDGTGSRTFAIPASHKALGGSDTAIASAAAAVTVLTASTVDNGATWRYAMQESA